MLLLTTAPTPSRWGLAWNFLTIGRGTFTTLSKTSVSTIVLSVFFFFLWKYFLFKSCQTYLEMILRNYNLNAGIYKRVSSLVYWVSQ